MFDRYHIAEEQDLEDAFGRLSKHARHSMGIALPDTESAKSMPGEGFEPTREFLPKGF